VSNGNQSAKMPNTKNPKHSNGCEESEHPQRLECSKRSKRLKQLKPHNRYERLEYSKRSERQKRKNPEKIRQGKNRPTQNPYMQLFNSGDVER